MKFSEIPGNEKVKESLRLLADSKNIPHAIMLSGVSGIGKMSLARAFVQYVHCQSPRNGEPCGECQSCRQHQSFNHADLHFIYPIVKNKAQKVEISKDRIDLWKEMLEKYPWMEPEQWLALIDAGNSQPRIYVEDADYILHGDALSTYSANYKFFVIWLPEKMNVETANKLLKVIEEPAEGTVFVLVSNSEAEVLPTIFSRTQRFVMLPVDEENVAGYVAKKYGLDRETSRQIARLSHGSLGRAEEFASNSGERMEFRAVFQDVMRAAYAKKPKELRDIGDKLAGFGREKLLRFLNYMGGMMRENFIYNLRLPQIVAMTAEEEMFSRRFAPFIHYGNIEELQKSIEDAARDIARNGNSKLVLFSLFLQIIPLIHKKAQ